MRKNTQEVRMELERRRDQYQRRRNRLRKQLITVVGGGLCCVVLVVAMLFPARTLPWRRTIGDSDLVEYGGYGGYRGKPQPETTPGASHSGESSINGNSSDVNPDDPMGPEQLQELQEAVQESAHYQQGQYEYYLLNVDTGIRALRVVENKSETLITDPAEIRAFLNLLYDTIAEDTSNTSNCVWDRGWKNYRSLNGNIQNPYMNDESVGAGAVAEKLEVRVLFGSEERSLYWTMDETRKRVLREQLQK